METEAAQKVTLQIAKDRDEVKVSSWSTCSNAGWLRMECGNREEGEGESTGNDEHF